MPWALPVPLLADELLSSWLARAALRQGCDPLALTGSIWPKWRIWTRDPDRGLDADRLDALAAASGLPSACLQGASLLPLARIIHGSDLPAAIWPWLLMFGIRNRRHHAGLQFCPRCLDADAHPYFRRQWRLASHTVCSVHRVQLLDRCPACTAPPEPHRLLAQDRHLALCAHCRADLRRAPCLPASDEALRFQLMASQALSLGHGNFGPGQIPAHDWFCLSRAFLGFLRRTALHQTSSAFSCLAALGIDTSLLPTPATGLALELLPVAERAGLLGAVAQLILCGPQRFLDAADAASMTRGAMMDRANPPCSALQPLIEALSPSASSRRQASPRLRVSQPRSRQAVLRMYARLRRRMQP